MLPTPEGRRALAVLDREIRELIQELNRLRTGPSPEGTAASALLRAQHDRAAARRLARQRRNFAGGRPRSNAPRCGCGAMTLKRAQARGRTGEHQPGCEFYGGKSTRMR